MTVPFRDRGSSPSCEATGSIDAEASIEPGMSGYVCVVGVPAMSISDGDVRPVGQVMGCVWRGDPGRQRSPSTGGGQLLGFMDTQPYSSASRWASLGIPLS